MQILQVKSFPKCFGVSNTHGSYILHGTGTGKSRVSVLCYVLYTLHRGRDRYMEPLSSIVPIPFPVPVLCSVSEPLVSVNGTHKFYSNKCHIQHLVIRVHFETIFPPLHRLSLYCRHYQVRLV